MKYNGKFFVPDYAEITVNSSNAYHKKAEKLSHTFRRSEVLTFSPSLSLFKCVCLNLYISFMYLCLYD